MNARFGVSAVAAPPCSYATSPCLSQGIGEAMFVWMTRYPEGPQLSAELMGVTDSFLFLLAGFCRFLDATIS